ncbi:tRNA glutamyl-Q(34) synthetase GluQRS [Tropicibacter naphthalenivorans]|uniref:Glutamate--tRNA ligase n=1 Tax=Tropicibacter naphthalenivorans TaxID=441103 RepID=A0A0P1GN04_9RHOB|nr:tRNA glutamyl-Q(34) synthetase GluQRS [Tropicibacter naphthalenivorans]CUH77261.1 Glutamate--tRNA ligase [Tropicibacter naphthalenivorans]SMC59462.1 glutamyl-Q tRNA(Asp) synthetase [Tropicibacter naphthalenivorans]
MAFKTRFAPSPTGPLHLGHAYSALLAYDMARGGAFLLRIEDIDSTRSRPQWEAQIYEDLAWLGLDWPAPVMRQSDRLDAYRDALQDLWTRGLIYPCSCTRRDIQAAMSAPQEGAEPAYGPDGLVYPGTCRRVPTQASPPEGTALRLNMAAALEALDGPLMFEETGAFDAPQTVQINTCDLTSKVGDIVLSRKDFPGSYHLSVVLDDAAQGITHVVRGRDLFEATQIHVVLQRLLGLPTPVYHHHRLIRDEHGKRLAKRDDARAIALYRAEGRSPQDIREMVGLPAR